MGKGKNVAIGAAIAGAVGYVAGILTAPKSGRATRRDIKDAALKAKLEAEKQLKSLHTQTNTLLQEGKTAAAKLSGDAKKDWLKLEKGALASREKLRAVLSSIHDGGADDEDLQAVLKDANKAIVDLKKYLTKHAKAS